MTKIEKTLQTLPEPDTPTTNMVGVIQETSEGLKFEPYGMTGLKGGIPVYAFNTYADYEAAAPMLPETFMFITLDDLATGGFEFDSELSETSRNAVQNLVLTGKFRQIENNAYKYRNGSYLHLTDLGTSYTQELKEDILSGSFKKAVVGGYLTINGHVYYFAHPDYWLNTGDTPCTTHHMAVVPAGSIVDAKMNEAGTTEGGYIGSAMKSDGGGIAQARAIIQADFGAANILTHRELFVNAVTNGKPSNHAWYDSDIDLMNEPMVYGSYIFTPACDGTTISYRYTIDKSQLALFAMRPDLICNRAYWWLRDVVSGADFAVVAWNGSADCNYASFPFGVRPAFGIC